MKVFLASILLLGASTVAASADSFTFTSTSTPGSSLSVPVPGGAPVGGGFSTGSSHIVYLSGTKTTSMNQCLGWSADRGSIFTSEGVCTFAESNGNKASIVFSCNATNKERTAADCWGALSGTAGTVKDKTGTISWHQMQGADGKSGTAVGIGMWN